jgi:hypothetical protein
VLDGGRQTSVDVAVVQLAVQDQKLGITVHQRSNRLSVWPRCLLKELLSQSIEPVR